MSRADAIAAAERGWAIFPLLPGMKRATLNDWPNKACADPERVARYWPSDRHGIGIATGKSNLVVIDLDTHGELPEDWQLPGINDGKDVFVQICEWAGMDFPVTYTVRTPSDGWHLYFQAPEGADFHNTASKLGPCVDTRASGGCVVGAGSVTAAGAYEVLYDEPVIELPNWIARLLAPEQNYSPGGQNRRTGEQFYSGPGRLQGLVRTVESAQPGTRNNALFWAACTLAEYAPQDMDQIAAAAARSGLDDREINRTIHSARLRVGAL